MQVEEILDQLFTKNKVETTLTIGGKFNFLVRNTVPEDLFFIDKTMNSVKADIKLHSIQLYALAKLSTVLISFNNEPFASPDAAFEFLKKRPVPIIDALSKAYATFEKEINAAVTGEEINNSFLDQGDSGKK